MDLLNKLVNLSVLKAKELRKEIVISRVIAAMSTSALCQLSNSVTSIVAIAFFFRYYGSSLYGEWLLLQNFFSIFFALFGGFSSVVFNEVILRIESEVDYSRKLIWNLQYLAIFVLMFLCILLVSIPGSYWSEFLSLAETNPTSARILLFLFTIQQLLQQVQGAFSCMLRACDKNALSIGLGGCTVSTVNLVTVLFLWLWGYPIYLASLTALVWFFSTVATFLFAFYLKRDLCVPTPIQLGVFSTILKPGFAFVLYPLSLYFRTHGCSIIVAKTLGPDFVSLIATLRTICNFGLQHLPMVQNSFQPEMTIAHARRDMQLMRSLIVHAVRIATGLSIAISLGLLVGIFLFGFAFNLKFIEDNLVLFFAVFFSTNIYVFWMTAQLPLLATNNHSRVAFLLFLVSFVSLIAFYYATLRFGLYGLAFILLMSEIVVCWAVLMELMVFSGISVRKFLRDILFFGDIR